MSAVFELYFSYKLKIITSQRAVDIKIVYFFGPLIIGNI